MPSNRARTGLRSRTRTYWAAAGAAPPRVTSLAGAPAGRPPAAPPLQPPHRLGVGLAPRASSPVRTGEREARGVRNALPPRSQRRSAYLREKRHRFRSALFAEARVRRDVDLVLGVFAVQVLQRFVNLQPPFLQLEEVLPPSFSANTPPQRVRRRGLHRQRGCCGRQSSRPLVALRSSLHGRADASARPPGRRVRGAAAAELSAVPGRRRAPHRQPGSPGVQTYPRGVSRDAPTAGGAGPPEAEKGTPAIPEARPRYQSLDTSIP